MVFSHPFFVYGFLPLLFLCYYIAKSDGTRRAILILFSLVFYAWGEPVYVFLMIFSVAFNYLFGRLIDLYRRNRFMKKLWLVLAVILNLGILVFFKYTGFLVSNFNGIFRTGFTVPSIVMPIGISFFTFQAMSYVIDVYRGDTEVQMSFPRLLLYVSFFPQLIAGPIVRYKDIEMQLDDMRVRPYDICDGMYRFAIGAAKKLLLADSCFAAATSFYGLTDEVTFVGRWMGAAFYALYIYYDFSGYSDMAIGLGKMFGFRFLENFDYPYASHTATEFWRRWHISLGTFFRDYVYIPLGGNRRHHLRNILVVWFLTGLWHGASWNFVIWGLFYGVLLIFEKKFFIRFLDGLGKVSYSIITRIYSAVITMFGFAIFYFTENTAKSIGYLFGIGLDSFSGLFTRSLITSNIFLLIIGVFFAYPIMPKLIDMGKRILGVSYEVRRGTMLVTTFVLMALATAKMVGNTFSPFLYWNF